MLASSHRVRGSTPRGPAPNDSHEQEMHTMKQLRILGLALLALFALSAVATSIASAEEGILEPQAFTIKGNKVTKLKNLGNEVIECKEVSGKGEFLPKSDVHAEGTLDFTGCTAGGFAANTLPDPSGTLLVPVLFLICLTNSALLQFGILILLLETLHIEVPIVKALILVKGAAIGSLTKAGEVEGTEFAVSFNEVDEEKRLKCEINGLKLTASLEAAIDTKADLDAFEVGEASVIFPKAVKFMDK
jgi:hypothetical protein